MADFGVLQTFGMPFEYNVASYTLHLIDLYSVRYGNIVLTLTGRERRIIMANSKQTSKSVATKASEILRNNRYSKTSKSVAASALAQTKT